MTYLNNPYRASGLATPILRDIPAPSVDAHAVQSLLAHCPHAAETPLLQVPKIAAAVGAGQIFLKDETQRMGLGSFKALGAAYVIAHLSKVENRDVGNMTFATASAGNHGLSVAAGAQAFGSKAVIFLADTVPEGFADRLRALGAKVIRHGADYEASMEGAATMAADKGWTLLSDSSWPDYVTLPHRLMEGYTALMLETGAQMKSPPTHIFLQAGVGGLAAACAAKARDMWGDTPHITVVEPENAPALYDCIAAGDFVTAKGPESAMGRLDCKEASLIALQGLSRDADAFMLISEDQGAYGAQLATDHGYPASPSGAAGLAGCAAGAPLGPDAKVLIVLSEGPA